MSIQIVVQYVIIEVQCSHVLRMKVKVKMHTLQLCLDQLQGMENKRGRSGRDERSNRGVERRDIVYGSHHLSSLCSSFYKFFITTQWRGLAQSLPLPLSPISFLYYLNN